MLGMGGEKALPPPGSPGQNGAQAGGTTQDTNATDQDGKKKKGFFGKIAGIFKDDKPSNPPANAPAQTGTAPQ
jgi:hypothetical protein